MDEFEKMISGKVYDSNGGGLPQKRTRAHKLCLKYNNTFEGQAKKRDKLLCSLLPNAQKDRYIQAPFYCDYGENITIGKNFYANFNLTILDCGKVEIGDDVFIGPNCTIVTPVHPLRPEQRNLTKNPDGSVSGLEYAKPIKIGNNCWIASSVTIIGGVTIGDGCVIGAGSVVTKDIPSGSLAFGNPCKVQRKITKKDDLEI